MALNSPSEGAASATPDIRRSSTQAGAEDILNAVKRQSQQVDVGKHWQTVQTYLTLGIGVFATRLKSGDDLRFHAYQACVAALLALAGHALLTMLGGVFQGGLRTLWDLAALGSWAYAVWRAAQGRPVNIPAVAGIARRQAAHR